MIPVVKGSYSIVRSTTIKKNHVQIYYYSPQSHTLYLAKVDLP